MATLVFTVAWSTESRGVATFQEYIYFIADSENRCPYCGYVCCMKLGGGGGGGGGNTCPSYVPLPGSAYEGL